uniref:Uncharacterized protein n=1 Tax=Rhizophora mucronata TaxID=61149 RepID=A0A2P2N9Z9_RHIMU
MIDVGRTPYPLLMALCWKTRTLRPTNNLGNLMNLILFEKK